MPPFPSKKGHSQLRSQQECAMLSPLPRLAPALANESAKMKRSGEVILPLSIRALDPQLLSSWASESVFIARAHEMPVII